MSGHIIVATVDVYFEDSEGGHVRRPECVEARGINLPGAVSSQKLIVKQYGHLLRGEHYNTDQYKNLLRVENDNTDA